MAHPGMTVSERKYVIAVSFTHTSTISPRAPREFCQESDDGICTLRYRPIALGYIDSRSRLVCCTRFRMAFVQRTPSPRDENVLPSFQSVLLPINPVARTQMRESLARGKHPHPAHRSLRSRWATLPTSGRD
jgi:hypothetical protein